MATEKQQIFKKTLAHEAFLRSFAAVLEEEGNTIGGGRIFSPNIDASKKQLKGGYNNALDRMLRMLPKHEFTAADAKSEKKLQEFVKRLREHAANVLTPIMGSLVKVVKRQIPSVLITSYNADVKPDNNIQNINDVPDWYIRDHIVRSYAYRIKTFAIEKIPKITINEIATITSNVNTEAVKLDKEHIENAKKSAETNLATPKDDQLSPSEQARQALKNFQGIIENHQWKTVHFGIFGAPEVKFSKDNIQHVPSHINKMLLTMNKYAKSEKEHPSALFTFQDAMTDVVKLNLMARNKFFTPFRDKDTDVFQEKVLFEHLGIDAQKVLNKIFENLCKNNEYFVDNNSSDENQPLRIPIGIIKERIIDVMNDTKLVPEKKLLTVLNNAMNTSDFSPDFFEKMTKSVWCFKAPVVNVLPQPAPNNVGHVQTGPTKT